jgi:hypothetical protein
MWVNELAGKVFFCTDNTPGAAVWVDASATVAASATKRIGFSYNYTETVIGQATYETIAAFIFSGTTFFGNLALRIKIAGSVDNAARVVDFRIQDVTNNLTIGTYSTFNLVSPGIVTISPLANVDNAEAIWELQAKKPIGQNPNSKLTLSGLQVEFV